VVDVAVAVDVLTDGAAVATVSVAGSATGSVAGAGVDVDDAAWGAGFAASALGAVRMEPAAGRRRSSGAA
jgi:hypothetical protein